MAPDSEYVCERCRESVSESATACPHCGYKPGKAHKRWYWIHGILTVILLGTIVGAPVALYTFWKGRKHGKRAKNASPAVKA